MQPCSVHHNFPCQLGSVTVPIPHFKNIRTLFGNGEDGVVTRCEFVEKLVLLLLVVIPVIKVLTT